MATLGIPGGRIIGKSQTASTTYLLHLPKTWGFSSDHSQMCFTKEAFFDKLNASTLSLKDLAVSLKMTNETITKISQITVS